MTLLPALVLALVPVAVGPSDTQTEPAADLKSRAIAHQQRANELFAAGQYKQALEQARASHMLYPSASTAFNIGLIQKKLGALEIAFGKFIEALNLADSDKVRDAVVSQLAEVGPELSPPRGWVTVNSLPQGATVYGQATGEQLGSAPLTLGLPQGNHRLLVAHRGHAPSVREVEVGAGAAVYLFVHLQPEGEPVARDTTPGEPTRPAATGDDEDATLSPLLLAGLGVGAVGIGTSLAAGYGVYYANDRVAEASAPWESRQEAIQIGVTMIGVMALGISMTVTGAVLTAIPLVGDDAS